MHKSVLLAEVVELLDLKRGGSYIDATLGGGGHATAILNGIGPEGRLLGIDRDVEALERTRPTLRDYESQCVLEHGNFADIAKIAVAAGFDSVDGVLMDVGVSSDQLDDSERGFRFSDSGPLDMRMDRTVDTTAADLVNTLSEQELADIFFNNADERNSRRIARVIVEARKKALIMTTAELVEVVLKAGGRRGRIHPATKVFQALRIAVNDELGALASGLNGGLSLLADGGRMAVISFHSKEDRIVKRFFAEHVGSWESLAEGGSRWCGKEPVMALVNKKPLGPTEEEEKMNRRARSAKLRVGERR